MKTSQVLAKFLKWAYAFDGRHTLFEEDMLNLRVLFLLFWRSRVAIVVSTLCGMIVVYGASFQLTPLFTSQSTVYAVNMENGSGNTLGGLGAVANALGYSLPGSSGGYLSLSELLGSRNILESLASTDVFPDSVATSANSLMNIWFPEASISRRTKMEMTIDRLRSRMKVSSSMESNLIHLEVSAENPKTAQLLNRLTCQLASDFYQETRREELSSKLSFLQSSTAEMAERLQNSEDRLTNFLSQNTLYAQSPVLLTEYTRLIRKIELNQRIFLELEAQLLSIRLEIVGQSPKVQTLNQPTLPLRPSSPERLKLIILAMFAFLALNALGILIANAVARPATSSEE